MSADSAPLDHSIGMWRLNHHTSTITLDSSAATILSLDGTCHVDALLSIIHRDELGFVRAALDAAREQAASIDIEFRLSRPLLRWIYLKGSPESGILFDSTARHRISLTTGLSEGTFHRIVEHAKQGVWVVDSSGKTVFANPEMARMLRCEPEQLLNRPALDFIFEDEMPQALEERDRRNSNSEGQTLEFRYRRADGTELWAHVSSSILPGPPDSPRLVLGVFSDRTEEKEAARQRDILLSQLASETELLERIIDAIPVMLTIYDPSVGQVTVNREFTRLLGWTNKDLAQGDVMQLCYADPAERTRALDFMKSLQPGWRDFRVTAKDGSSLPSSWANIGLSDQRVIGIGIDLRDRLAAEKDLRESEQRLKLALDAMELGTFDYDLLTRQVTWSERTKRCFGMSPDREVGFDTIWAAVPQEEIEIITNAVNSARESASGRYFVEHRTLGIDDGVERWVAAWGRVLLDESGRPRRYTGLNLDITERKRAERILAETRARQEILSEVVAGLLTTENPEGMIEDLVSKVLATTGADVFFNFLLDRNSDQLRLNTHSGLSPATVEAAARLPLGQAVCGMVALECSSRYLTSVLESDDPQTAVLRAEGVKTYACYPLMGAGRVLGTLGFGSRFKCSFEPEDIELFQSVANYVAIALQRLTDRDALKESEDRYRAIASNIPDGGVWVVDRDLRFVAIEGPLVTQLSSRGPSLLGQRLADVAPPALAELGIRDYRRALDGERIFSELEIAGRTLQAQVVPIRDASGAVVAAMALAFDITARKVAENALRESERRERDRAAELEAIMDAVPAATWVAHDRECRHITANRFGYDILRALPGGNVSKTAPPDETPQRFRVFRNGAELQPEDLPVQVAARTGKPVMDSDLEIHYSDGPPRYLFGNAMPLFDSAGNPSGAVGAFIDVTERRKVEDELRQTQKLESIGVLAGGVAHDFNNMLTGVLGNASLAMLNAPPLIAQRLANIADAAEKAAGLTRQLLAYAGKGQFLLSDVDVAKLIHSSTELLRISITRNIEINLDGVPPSLPAVRADISQLQQVIMNLVINGAEAIGPTTPGRITVSAGLAALTADHGNRLFIHVTDTGCGIPQDRIEKIFDPFYSTKFTGRGLGLAAVHGIVRSLKGQIRVESQVTFGTAFTVFLPCLEPAPFAELPRTGSKIEGSLAGLTVLVADDEPVIREISQAALEKYGCRVLLAADGQQAIDAMDANPHIQAVLLDIVMPVLGGLDAAIEIRNRRPEAAILLTSGFTREEATRMTTLPANIPFLQKPFTIQQLISAVVETVRLYNSTD